jgi:hypothetical protein
MIKVLMVKTSSARTSKKPSSPGLIILQWLTYAFWGWTILALAWLISIIMTTAISNIDTSDTVPYAIASVLVLLPIAAITDLFYTRHEPTKKTGAAMVVMVIHTVLFALFGIATLIIGVLSIVQLFIATGNATATKVTMYTAFIIAVFYAITFLRTLNPTKNRTHIYGYIGLMSAAVGMFAILGFTGPLIQASLSKDDRLIEKHISSIPDSIRAYTAEHDKLPQSLSDIKPQSDEAKQLIDRNLVRYTPGKEADQYTLCATYKKSKSDPNISRPYPEPKGESAYLFVYDHPAGEVCYNLTTMPKTEERPL